MILEHTIIAIKPGQAEDFEKAFGQAAPLIRAAHGCHSATLRRGIENPDNFLLLVKWETLEDHMVGFRESPVFKEWRAILGPYFASPAAVDHYAETI